MPAHPPIKLGRFYSNASAELHCGQVSPLDSAPEGGVSESDAVRSLSYAEQTITLHGRYLLWRLMTFYLPP